MEIIEKLVSKYGSLISVENSLPLEYRGTGKIKAIILGADPTHIVVGKPIPMGMVFNLDRSNSPYWRGIRTNLSQIKGLTMDNIFVQNVCRNYFKLETSKNVFWVEIARNYWIPYLKNELDNEFPKTIPILMTTEFILNAALSNQNKIHSALSIYTQCLYISEKDNLFNRKLFALYRHPKYSLKSWREYCEFLAVQINSTKA